MQASCKETWLATHAGTTANWPHETETEVCNENQEALRASAEEKQSRTSKNAAKMSRKIMHWCKSTSFELITRLAFVYTFCWLSLNAMDFDVCQQHESMHYIPQALGASAKHVGSIENSQCGTGFILETVEFKFLGANIIMYKCGRYNSWFWGMQMPWRFEFEYMRMHAG